MVTYITLLAESPFPTHVQAFLRDFKTNEPVSIINLNEKVFAAPLRRDILHRVVVWQRDNMRQGTHSTKTRSEVAGSGRKLAQQKGRGKARVGDGKAPQFRGGQWRKNRNYRQSIVLLLIYNYKKAALLSDQSQEITARSFLARYNRWVCAWP